MKTLGDQASVCDALHRPPSGARDRSPWSITALALAPAPAQPRFTGAKTYSEYIAALGVDIGEEESGRAASIDDDSDDVKYAGEVVFRMIKSESLRVPNADGRQKVWDDFFGSLDRDHLEKKNVTTAVIEIGRIAIQSTSSSILVLKMQPQLTVAPAATARPAAPPPAAASAAASSLKHALDDPAHAPSTPPKQPRRGKTPTNDEDYLVDGTASPCPAASTALAVSAKEPMVDPALEQVVSIPPLYRAEFTFGQLIADRKTLQALMDAVTGLLAEGETRLLLDLTEGVGGYTMVLFTWSEECANDLRQAWTDETLRGLNELFHELGLSFVSVQVRNDQLTDGNAANAGDKHYENSALVVHVSARTDATVVMGAIKAGLNIEDVSAIRLFRGKRNDENSGLVYYVVGTDDKDLWRRLDGLELNIRGVNRGTYRELIMLPTSSAELEGNVNGVIWNLPRGIQASLVVRAFSTALDVTLRYWRQPRDRDTAQALPRIYWTAVLDDEKKRKMQHLKLPPPFHKIRASLYTPRNKGGE
jgi:hypothetical protein